VKAIYKATDIVVLSVRSLVAHKFRSALSMLGIVFGVGSVIAMLAIIEGGRYEAEEAIRRMGSDNLLIESVKPPQEGTAAARERGALNYGITYAEARRLQDNLPGVVRSVVAHRTIKSAQRGARLIPVQVFGTGPAYLSLARLRLVGGRFLSQMDVLQARNYCVMTRRLARRLFGYEDPLGQSIRLGGETFEVIGLVDQPARTMAAVPAEMVSNLVFIPSTTDRTRFGQYTIVRTGSQRMMELVEVSQIILRMANEAAVLGGAAIARSLLKRGHDKRDYDVTVPLELIEQRRKQRRLWNIVFFMIAAVSLFISGIGIANIMLASVTERTREIGIRRALGAKRGDIITQFLVEAVTLTAVGGLIGIASGYPVPAAVERLLNIKADISPPMLAIPFLMAVAVGLLSGLYPAYRASRLDPIVALRHE